MTAAGFLVEWALRSSILIGAGALLAWAVRVERACLRATAWAALLCGSFSIPILSIPALNRALPKAVLPPIRRAAAGVVIQPAASAVSDATLTPAAEPIRSASADGDQIANAPAAAPAALDRQALSRTRIDWPRLGLALYEVVCSFMLLRLCAGLLTGLRLSRRSRATGLATHGVPIRESSEVASPMTMGIVRPVIMLPADWREWDRAKFEAVVAHERSHIQRHDPQVQMLSAIHRAVLWGNPMSWVLHRQVLQAAEEASDDAAVAAIQDPVSYAETLLEFMQRGTWNNSLAGLSMARHGNPARRIRRVLNSTSFSSGVAARSLAAIVAVASPLAYVIATAQARPQFEIADVHASAANNSVVQSVRGGGIRAGLYQLENATMVDLIKTAYGVDAGQVVGGPSWLELDRYDVFAKAPEATSAETAKVMLQALLADRFKLALHKDSRPLPGFALTAGRGGGSKLKKAAGAGRAGCNLTPQYSNAELGAMRQDAIQAGQTNPVILQTYLVACGRVTMGAFAEWLRTAPITPNLSAGASPNILADRTGLSGEWDFNFRFTSPPPAGAQAAEGENITFLDALDKQLGLKLEAAKIPTPVVVVDRVNRKPADNPPDVKAILAPPPPPEFEAADLKLSDPNAPEVRSPGPQPGGRFEVRNFPLNFLILIAWQLPTSGALTGAPDWLKSARVDLTAKLPSTDSTRGITGVVDMDAFVPALRALLTDRFKIAIHTEQRLVPGYALVAAKPKMRNADPTLRTKCFAGPGRDPKSSNPLTSTQVTCQNITMAELVKQLPSPLFGGYVRNAVLVDSTGLGGAYDFTLSFTATRNSPAQAVMGAAAGPATAADPDGPTLFDALEKQLGLKLEKRNLPAPVVTLDHIEEKPASN